MFKFLASSSSCKTFQVRIAERDVRTRKSAGKQPRSQDLYPGLGKGPGNEVAGKPNAEWLVRERIGKIKFGKIIR